MAAHPLPHWHQRQWAGRPPGGCGTTPLPPVIRACVCAPPPPPGGPLPMHSQQPPGVVQNWSTLQCSKKNTEQCGYDHAPVTQGRMRAQFPLPHGPQEDEHPLPHGPRRTRAGPGGRVHLGLGGGTNVTASVGPGSRRRGRHAAGDAAKHACKITATVTGITVGHPNLHAVWCAVVCNAPR